LAEACFLGKMLMHPADNAENVDKLAILSCFNRKNTIQIRLDDGSQQQVQQAVDSQ
jgi:hypothetical protein